MKRRALIALLGAAALASPLAARAQPSMPVIGFLTARGPGDLPRLMAAFHNGLKSAGFVEGQNVAIEYRFADSRNERLPALAADLVQRQVTVIAAMTTPAAIAAQAATTTTPIVFETGTDPIQLGLVASLNRPGGNVTGVTNMIVEVAPKRLELLHELLPTTTRMALLVNPADWPSRNRARCWRPLAPLGSNSISLTPPATVTSMRCSPTSRVCGQVDS